MLASEIDPRFGAYGCSLPGCGQAFQVTAVQSKVPEGAPEGTEPVEVTVLDVAATRAHLAAHRESDCTGTMPEPPAAPNAATPGAEVVVTGDGSRYLMTVDADGTRRVDQIGR